MLIVKNLGRTLLRYRSCLREWPLGRMMPCIARRDWP